MADTGTPLSGIGLAKEPVRTSAWAPLRESIFRSLWIAAIVSYTGTWMQNVGAGWLMASLTNSPIMVGLVQSAMSLPVFLVSLVAGALADMVDRRKLLLACQTWMVVAAVALGLLTLIGMITPLWLLFFTFLLGLGNAMNDPAWQAITHEIVSEENFAPAVALNSAGFNVARAVGPAIGGLVIAAAGAGSAFILNAASFFGVIYVLYRWKRRPHEDPMPARHVVTAIKAGFKFARHSSGIQSVLIRTAVFSLSAAALWAMLPLIAKPYGSVGYGILLGIFGIGALCGAAVLPYLRRAFSVDMLVGGATIIYAFTSALAGYFCPFWLHGVVLFLAGSAWLLILASLNVCAQIVSPPYLRARTLSMYLLVLQGGMAAGSTIWGAVADRYGIFFSLAAAGVCLALGLVTTRWHRLRTDSLHFRPTPVEG